MKTKAYKLAAELGLHEQSVLDWLKSNGYPSVRRADTIRAEVVVAARKALGRMGGAAGLRPAKPFGRGQEVLAPSVSGEDMRVSFAELLEQHLSPGGPVPVREPRDTEPVLRAQLAATAVAAIAAARPSVAPLQESLEARLTRAEEARELARREVDEWKVRLNRVRSERDEFAGLVKAWGPDMEVLPGVRVERERLAQEVTVLRHRLKATDDERATLESTCAELQDELAEVRAGLVIFEGLDEDRRQVQDELHAASQREMAWRARALELERAALLGGTLQAALSRTASPDVGDQAAVLRAILGHREGATVLLRMLRPTDAEALSRLVSERVRRVCVDSVCNQVAAGQDVYALRVDAERDCVVCGGSEERRWFARMALECERAGARRLLLVGGPEAVTEHLRTLSQGHRVDFRLVSATDEIFAARVQGRVEGCDLLVLWGSTGLPASVREAYVEAAHREGRPAVHVVGPRQGVVLLCRAVCNRLARSLVLTTH